MSLPQNLVFLRVLADFTFGQNIPFQSLRNSTWNTFLNANAIHAIDSTIPIFEFAFFAILKENFATVANLKIFQKPTIVVGVEKRMHSEIKKVYNHLKNQKDWKLEKVEENIQYFRNETHIKTEAIVNLSKIRLMTMASDISCNTRCQWDPHVNMTLTVLEEHENVHVVGFNGTVGIQWKNDSFIVYTTIVHERYNATDKTRDEYLIWIKELDDKKCFFTCIGFRPYVKLNYMLKANYIEIYSPWDCKTCDKKKIPAHELECRQCKSERYTRCKDYKCYGPQQKGNLLCQYCGKELSENKP